MALFFKGFYTPSTATGATALSLSSTVEEPKTLEAIRLTDVDTNPVVMTVYLEREKIIDSVHLNLCNDLAPPLVFLAGRAIPAGQTLTVQFSDYTSGSAGTVTGFVEYSIGAK